MARSSARGSSARVAALEVGRSWPSGRRWPWAVAAVVAGGLAGGAVAAVGGRRRGVPADEVQEPDEVEAVVDRPDPAAGA